MPTMPRWKVFLDPPYKVYYGDRLFGDPSLNRDNCLAHFVRLKEHLERQGAEVHTVDQLLPSEEAPVEYYSFGVLDNYRQLGARSNVRLAAFVLLEPTVVVPELYSALGELTAAFQRVYVHNTHGHGYRLEGVDQAKLRKLYVPQPYADGLEPYWSRQDRARRIVMINGNHRPVSRFGELYSKRIEAAVGLARFGAIDLFGQGWSRWWSRNSLWWPYWCHRRQLMAIYHGPCASKYEVLSHYQFSLCFENMAMDGYITEKIFDCFYTGTVPIYLGGTDYRDYLPEEAFVDGAAFGSWEELWFHVRNLTDTQVSAIRAAGRAFLRQEGSKYRDSLVDIVEGR